MTPLEEMHRVFAKHLKLADTEPLDVIMAAIAAIREDDIPLWIMLVGPPGTGKTEMLLAFQGIANPPVVCLSKLTPRTLVSGWAAGGSKSNTESLLMKLPPRSLLMIKEFTTCLRMRSEDRNEVMSQLREVYDGRLDSYYGTGGKVEWQGKLGILAGVTEVIDSVSPFEQMLGERFLMLRLRFADRIETAIKALHNSSREATLKRELGQAARAAIAASTIKASEVKFDEERIEQIAALADFIAVARTSAHRDPSSRQILSSTDAEGPSRLARQFGLLVRSLAAVRGRKTIHDQDLATTRRVGLDSLIPRRKKLLETLLHVEGTAPTTDDVAELLQVSKSAARYVLEEASSVRGGFVEREEGERWKLTERAVRLLVAMKAFVTEEE